MENSGEEVKEKFLQSIIKIKEENVNQLALDKKYNGAMEYKDTIKIVKEYEELN